MARIRCPDRRAVALGVVQLLEQQFAGVADTDAASAAVAGTDAVSAVVAASAAVAAATSLRAP